LIAHLTNAAAGIVLVNAYDAGRIRWVWADRIAWLFPLMVQFSFGALFSGFVVLYVRSGSFVASWLFLALLAFLLVGNEFFRSRYRRLIFHLSVYFVALYAYLILAVPVVTNRIGAEMFLVSGAIALALITLFGSGLRLFAPPAMRERKRVLTASIGIIFTAFNLLYFTNAIPPIPLALKRLGVYHAVEAINGSYRISYEPAPSNEFFRQEAKTFHWRPGEAVYAGSAVFAPADIRTGIIHRWLRFDPTAKQWVETDRMLFTITGGRDQGWRGYTLKYGVTPGWWRVEVRTARGQLLGRTTFEIAETGEVPKLETRTL
ncbi:MAG: DUF2914 domain-containing protein, partial [bacterium]|nr:DUF2914 domain-containing protein [bacterium]